MKSILTNNMVNDWKWSCFTFSIWFVFFFSAKYFKFKRRDDWWWWVGVQKLVFDRHLQALIGTRHVSVALSDVSVVRRPWRRFCLQRTLSPDAKAWVSSTVTAPSVDCWWAWGEARRMRRVGFTSCIWVDKIIWYGNWIKVNLIDENHKQANQTLSIFSYSVLFTWKSSWTAEHYIKPIHNQTKNVKIKATILSLKCYLHTAVRCTY